jgi:8-oxo-dGTP diphosphatase
MKKYLHVAVGVIENKSGEILIAKRPDSAHQGGLWEFPGGKVDAGETLQSALSRELKEELAIDVLQSQPLIQIRHDYPDKSVLLDVHRVTSFSGEPKGNEGQPVLWVNTESLSQYAFPAANQSIINAVRLPQRFSITGSYSSIEDFERKFSNLILQNIKLIQLRIKSFSYREHQAFLQIAAQLSAGRAQLQINTSVDEFIKLNLPNTRIGLHLNAEQMKQHASRPVDEKILLGASCHSIGELKQAEKIQVDYVLLSPVNFTQSHPDTQVLGWKTFQDWVKQVNIPVFALGGMQESDVLQAINTGAQGIASISAWWNLPN